MKYEIRAELPDGKHIDFTVSGPSHTEDNSLEITRQRAEYELIKRYPDYGAPHYKVWWVGFVLFVRHRISPAFQKQMNTLVGI